MEQEPEFQIEQGLEAALATAIKHRLAGTHSVVLCGFGLDLVVFGETDRGEARTCFFETKVYKPTSGRCGINTNQVRLLFDDAAQKPRTEAEIILLDNSVRWVLGDCSKPAGSQRFLFFSCKQAQAAAMGGIRSRKQNNLLLSKFNGLWITWPDLLNSVANFIKP